MNFLSDINLGVNKRKYTPGAIWFGLGMFVLVFPLTLSILFLVVPIVDVGGVIYPAFTPAKLAVLFGSRLIDATIEIRTIASALIATVASIYGGVLCFVHLPMTEPFTQPDGGDPRIFFDEDAEIRLKQVLADESSDRPERGMFVAPHISVTRQHELHHIAIIGDSGGGKSNLIRPMIQQAINRGDFVVLHCTKGDVASSFRTSEVVLLSPTHQDGWAWDMGSDIRGPADAAELSAIIVPRSEQPFFSDTARLILSDIINSQIGKRGEAWGPRELIEDALSDRDQIAKMIAHIDLSASPLLGSGSGDSDGVSRTIESVLTTLLSAALTTLRPMAHAWRMVPRQKHFSVRAMLSPEWHGPKVLIVQSHPDFETLSKNICGGLLRRICQHVAAPAHSGSVVPRVTLALDEFFSLGLEGFERSLSVAREKGLAVIIALQSTLQLKQLYGDRADQILGYFQLKIYCRQEPGEAANAISASLGNRRAIVTEKNMLPAAADKRLHVSMERNIPVFSPTQLAGQLGNFHPATKAEVIKGLIAYRGQAYRIDWPPTKWIAQSDGFIPAAWTKTIALKTGRSRIR